YELPEAAENRYRKYLNTIADSYSDDTTQAIRKVLDNAATQGLSSNQTEAALRNVMNTDEWRVKRLANTEVNRSGALSSVEAMTKIQDETGVTIEKTMEHTGGDVPCEFCATRFDVWFEVDKVMIPKG